MLEREKKFQIKLWLGVVLGSLVTFVAIKLVWNDVSYLLLLLLLMVGFLINLVISTIKLQKNRCLQE